MWMVWKKIHEEGLLLVASYFFGCHSIFGKNYFQKLLVVVLCLTITLPDDKILDWSILKHIADDILKCI